MKTVFQHIEHVKGKPHHVRKKVAFATAAVGTTIIAFVWLVSSVGTGVFALKATSFAQSTADEGALIVQGDNNSQSLAGAAAAGADANAPARIEIIDTSASTSLKKAEQTTIPF